MRIGVEVARSLAIDLLGQRGASVQNACLQADLLVEAELRGHPSHGLLRLPRLLARIERGLVNPSTRGEAEWRSNSVLAVEGMTGLGPAVAMDALDRLKTRAADAGIVMAVIRNSNHLGMLAPYVETIAGWGCVGVAISSSEALVHPHGGVRALLGTNPIAIAVPTGERPMVLDLATSIVSMGKIHHYGANDMPLPTGWARDAQGRPTTSAKAAKDGAIAPFGGAKGYGLGLALELLVASLAGSDLAPDVRGTLDAEFVCNKGDVLIAIQTQSQSARRIADYLELIRRSPSADPGQPVAVPGDGAAFRRARSLREGFEIDAALWAELNSLGHQFILEGHTS